LVDLYLNSNNYEEALASIEKIPDKTDELEIAYQQIAFFRGIELFNVNEFDDAISLFKTASSYNYEPVIRARARYWTGESFFRLENYWAAVKYFNEFVNDRASRETEEYASAYYNLGYSHFKRKEYSQAVSSFRKFINEAGRSDTRLIQEAYLRIADANFINKKYSLAISNYERATELGKSGSDYALFQKASSEGALGDFNKKISTLKMLERGFPSSIYHDDALYEIATTYLIVNDQPSALDYFDKLVKRHPKSSLAIKALMRSGLIYYNAGENKAAIRTFKAVIEKYPGSAESKEALSSLRKVYVETGNVNEYYDYASQFTFADVTANERDSVTYSIAEMKYMEGNCSEATGYFEKYLDDFPDGFHSTNAHFYSAECYFKQNRKEKALQSYLKVLEKPSAQFIETVLVRVAGMYFDRKEFNKALTYFEELEEVASYPENKAYARSGLMRCALEMGNLQEAINAGNDLLTSEAITAELRNEVHITLARAYFKLGKKDEALDEYEKIRQRVQNEWAAEAQYHVALILFDKGQLDESEENIFELADKFGSYDYWVAKGFILLSDIYAQKENYFQAKQTLQSIIDNYTGPDLGEVARRKLAEIEKLEIMQEEVPAAGENENQ
jgi:TolA-binding protein